MDAPLIAPPENSTHRVDTFIFNKSMLMKHPSADTLSIIVIPGTDFTYVCKTEEWLQYDNCLACWVQPDSLCDVTRSEFTFLGEKGSRIRARKIRGIISYGLLIALPDNHSLKPGDDAADFLGVKHYEPDELPEEDSSSPKSYSIRGAVAKSPSGSYPKYGLNSFLRYGRITFQEGETVCFTEKLNGCNARYIYRDNQMYCGSRDGWKKEYTEPLKMSLDELTTQVGDAEKAKEIFDRMVTNFQKKKNFWWEALESTPNLREFCEAHPGWCVYGEVYGQVRGFSYGLPKEKFTFRAFDILIPPSSGELGRWLNSREFFDVCKKFNLPHVPIVSIEPFNFDKALSYAEGNSIIEGASHIREGVVIRPMSDRWDSRGGRVSYKIINPKYLEKN